MNAPNSEYDCEGWEGCSDPRCVNDRHFPEVVSYDKMLTPQRLFIVVEVTSFLPGRKIPADWVKESQDGEKPYFFIPSNWNEENCWDGTWINYGLPAEKRFPICYSIGFETAEKALIEATRWEATIKEREEKRGYRRG